MIYKSRHPERWFAHIDCDCFFVSVERINKTWLRGKPVCVGGVTGNGGVVTCASYEARPFGIRAGTPVFKAREMCPHAIFIKGSIRQYGDISYKLFAIMDDYSPEVEHISIDEGYINLTGIDKIHHTNFLTIGQTIQQRVLKELKIPISMGIAPTKTLAKLASNFNKPFGIGWIKSETLQEQIETVPIGQVCGFGYRLQKKLLIKHNITTVGQFCSLNGDIVARSLGLPGLVLWHELNGTALKKLKTGKSPPKSILRSAMFPQKTNDYNLIKDWLHARLEEACKKLASYDLACKGIGTFLRLPHKQRIKHYQGLPEATGNYQALSKVVNTSLHHIYNNQLLFKAGGIWLGPLEPINYEQPQLPGLISDLDNKLIKTINQCENKHGRNIVTTAARLQSKYKKDQFNLAFVG